MDVRQIKSPPSKWIDRPIDDKKVDELVEVYINDPLFLYYDQRWIGVVNDFSKEEVERDQSLLNGAEITIIGGLHRHAAVKKVSYHQIFQ